MLTLIGAALVLAASILTLISSRRYARQAEASAKRANAIAAWVEAASMSPDELAHRAETIRNTTKKGHQ